jgi:hypothetical protein
MMPPAFPGTLAPDLVVPLLAREPPQQFIHSSRSILDDFSRDLVNNL